MNPIRYRTGNALNLDQVIDLYRTSTLGDRRPVEKREVMRSMIENADLIVSAWEDDHLVGIARTLTDFAYVAYLADLAVDQAVQQSGIGKQLIEETRKRLGPDCMITLLAAPDANDYYPKVGFAHNPRAWTLGPQIRP